MVSKNARNIFLNLIFFRNSVHYVQNFDIFIQNFGYNSRQFEIQTKQSIIGPRDMLFKENLETKDYNKNH